MMRARSAIAALCLVLLSCAALAQRAPVMGQAPGAAVTSSGPASSVTVTSLPALPPGASDIGTVDLGNLNGAATDASLQSILTRLGFPFQAGASIANTQFGATQSGTWAVGINSLPALPSGANTIGAVSQAGTWTAAISTLPALPAGANAIGSVGQSGTWNVGVSVLPALPSGANTIGAVSQAGTWTAAISTLPALPAGTNSIGSVAQSGAWTTGITSLPALPAGTNAIGSITQGSPGTLPWLTQPAPLSQPWVDASFTATSTAATPASLAAVSTRLGLRIWNLSSHTACISFTATAAYSGTACAPGSIPLSPSPYGYDEEAPPANVTNQAVSIVCVPDASSATPSCPLTINVLTAATPANNNSTYTLPNDGLPNVVYMADASEPPQTLACGGTTYAAPNACIQIDSSGDVLEVNDPVSQHQVGHGTGELKLHTDTSGRPYFGGDGPSSSYDGLKWPGQDGAVMAVPSGQPMGCLFVISQYAAGASDLISLHTSSFNPDIDAYGASGATDGRLSIGQNSGAAVVNEAASSYSALNNLQVLVIATDGTKYFMSRGNYTAATSPTGPIGGFTLANFTGFELLNSPKSNTYVTRCWVGWPGTAVMGAAVSYWDARFGITDPGTYSAGPAGAVQPLILDLTQTYTTTPNMPVSDTPPVLAGEASASNPTGTTPTLPDGLTMAAGATALATYDFTPGGNVNTRTLLDKYMYYQGLNGNQTTNQYSCSNGGFNGIEGDAWNACNGTGSNWGRARTYASSNINYQLMNFTTTGLNLSSLCTLNDTNAGCGPNTIYNTLVRPTVLYQPGQILEVDMQAGGGSSASQLFYQGVALYSGSQHTPGAGNSGSAYNNPVSGPPWYGGPITDQSCYLETDLGDNYYASTNIPIESQFKIGVVPVGSYLSSTGNLTMTSATYDTTSAQFGGGALSGGYGLSPMIAIMNLSYTYTIDAWEKTSTLPANTTVIAGQYQAGWIGMDASGHVVGNYGSAASDVTMTSSSTYADGSWHFVREVFGPAGATLSVDGTVVGTNAASFASVDAQQYLIYYFGVRNYTTSPTYTGGTVSGDSIHTFPGEVDDVALWFNGMGLGQSTTAVPSSTFAGTETWMVMGYHLNSSGNAARPHLCYRVGPHVVYAANGSHFIYHPVTSKVTGSGQTLPYLQLNGDTLNSTMHRLVEWKTNDGSNLTYIWWDGTLALIEYFEESPFSPGYWIDFANQTSPSFAPATTNAAAHYGDITNGGNPINAPVSNTVARLRVISGSITSLTPTDANGVTNYNNGGGAGDTINGLY